LRPPPWKRLNATNKPARPARRRRRRPPSARRKSRQYPRRLGNLRSPRRSPSRRRNLRCRRTSQWQARLFRRRPTLRPSKAQRRRRHHPKCKLRRHRHQLSQRHPHLRPRLIPCLSSRPRHGRPRCQPIPTRPSHHHLDGCRRAKLSRSISRAGRPRRRNRRLL
jgi:hypothetical protein